MDFSKAVIYDDLFDDSINEIKSPHYRRLLKEKEKEENNEYNRTERTNADLGYRYR